MNTLQLQNFAVSARQQLMNAVDAQMESALAPHSRLQVDSPDVFDALKSEIQESGGGAKGKARVIERYAYRWFNRIIAFRYMDVHEFTQTPVVSAANLMSTSALPEILSAAKRGEYDDEIFNASGTGNARLRETIEGLFNGIVHDDDPQSRAYGLLIQATCRYWNKFMPFMFENTNNVKGKVDEALMPPDLLAEGSVLRKAAEVMTPNSCESVEVIGWLYQFYISERKDAVMASFKKSKKAGADEIPAATQLFTPDWIVQYLVQNTVGRLWMQNHPECELYKDWEYYIAPSHNKEYESEDTSFLKISSPEELTVCDPACGSGHMLTYAFDLLYSIYSDEGYAPSEIPEKILEKNLFGMEIDERAANLAAFALSVKAREKSRRFFNKQAEPNIRQISPHTFTEDEVDEINRSLQADLSVEQWNVYRDADVLGSLIRPDDEIVRFADEIVYPEQTTDITLLPLLERVKLFATQTKYLTRKYAAVVANPPYMGSSNMGDVLKQYVHDNYRDGKADLMTCFMIRAKELTSELGYWAMINLPSWIALSSFKELREWLLSVNHIESFIDLGRGIFGSDFGSVAFVCRNAQICQSHGYYRRLFERHVEVRTVERIRLLFLDESYHVFTVDQQEFAQIPGSPIVYWLSRRLRRLFANKKLGSMGYPKKGITTGNNERYLRLWAEISASKLAVSDNHASAKWVPYNKGGEFRRWYGNREYVLNFENNGRELEQQAISKEHKSLLVNKNTWWRSAYAWSSVGSGDFSARYTPVGSMFDNGGSAIFAENEQDLHYLGAIVNSSLAQTFFRALAPTLNVQPGNVASLPLPSEPYTGTEIENELVEAARADWDSSELSWDFRASPLVSVVMANVGSRNSPEQQTISNAVSLYIDESREIAQKQRAREFNNNNSIAELYGMLDGIDCDVPLERVSLKRNSAFVYPDKTPTERDESFARDLVKELISYVVGCMFGRYSIDEPGLILASQGETLDDYNDRVSDPRFMPDKDNVIPVTSEDCFEDDIVSRFRKFLEIIFGKEQQSENIAYIEQVLGKDLRTYFVNDFYNDHVKMYKNRPIYWQYSSRTDNKGAFKALIYMHRYTPKTTNVVLGYLRDFTAKIADLAAQLEGSDRNKDKRDAEKLRSAITECKAYEDQTLYPLATRNMQIDLDDGVLVNYLRMGKAVRSIPAIEKKRKAVEAWTWPVHPLGK
jgi:hypothetical protein